MFSETYTINSAVETSDLNVTSYVITSSKSATDLFGNDVNTIASISDTDDRSLAQNANVVIDTQPPQATITGVEYDSEQGLLKIEGSGFTASEFGLAGGATNVLNSINWGNLTWDIDSNDGAAITNVSFAVSDFSSAVISSASLITATLTSEKNSALLGTSGFGQYGGVDAIDALTGLFKDAAGNVSTQVDQDDLTITYTDESGPSQPKFAIVDALGAAVTSASYKELEEIYFTATFTKSSGAADKIQPGTSFEATLDITDSLDDPITVTFYASDTPSNVITSHYEEIGRAHV